MRRTSSKTTKDAPGQTLMFTSTAKECLDLAEARLKPLKSPMLILLCTGDGDHLSDSAARWYNNQLKTSSNFDIQITKMSGDESDRSIVDRVLKEGGTVSLMVQPEHLNSHLLEELSTIRLLDPKSKSPEEDKNKGIIRLTVLYQDHNWRESEATRSTLCKFKRFREEAVLTSNFAKPKAHFGSVLRAIQNEMEIHRLRLNSRKR